MQSHNPNQFSSIVNYNSDSEMTSNRAIKNKLRMALTESNKSASELENSEGQEV